MRLALFTVMLVACIPAIVPGPVVPGPVEPEPVVVPEPVEPAGPSCEGWCDKARELGCAAARPSPAGATCAERCRHRVETGLIPIGLACRETATSCDAAAACEDQ